MYEFINDAFRRFKNVVAPIRPSKYHDPYDEEHDRLYMTSLNSRLQPKKDHTIVLNGEIYKREDIENDDVHYEDYSFLDSIVPKTDDPMTPCFTLRAVVIGTFWAVLLSVFNTILSFRTNPFSVGSSIVVILSYPMGRLWALLPYHPIFNPGNFSLKEHVIICKSLYCVLATFIKK